MRLMKAKVARSSREDLCNVRCFKEGLVTQLRARMPADAVLDEARTLFAALADRTRLKILYALSRGDELCVCDVAHVLGMSVAATSHHLRKLRQLGVLRLRNDGRMAYYSLASRFAVDLAARAVRKAAA
jgi:ArsR family transcriptional regulator, lead/cadmium/zinc/bismuth-responsive transcriptional repressor